MAGLYVSIVPASTAGGFGVVVGRAGHEVDRKSVSTAGQNPTCEFMHASEARLIGCFHDPADAVAFARVQFTRARGGSVSLTVPAALLEKAQQGTVADEEFVDCIRESLPYAWSMVERLAKELEASGAPSAQNLEVPPDERSWGEVFRLVGSDSMRGAVQRHFGVRLAFQNCCRVGLFRPDATAEYEEFVSPRAQLLNQKPELLNC